MFISNLINFGSRAGKNYHSQVFVEEYKHLVKEKKISEYITDDIEISYDDFDGEVSDEENFNPKKF